MHLIRYQIRNHVVGQRRFPMSLEIDIKMAYVEQEVVETAAREPEARIRKIEDAVRLALVSMRI